MNKKIADASLFLLSFFQALGVSVYISLVSLIFWRGNEWFGSVDSYLSPILVLILLVMSALICGVIVFAQPFLFWQAKRPKKALKLVVYTAAWLVTIFFMIAAAVIFLV